MAFCIECGAKVPDMAKFCPQCGAKLVEIDPVSETVADPIAETPEADVSEGTASIEEQEPKAETDSVAEEHPETETHADADAVDSPPSATASIKAAADRVADDEPKSKAGLLIGVGLLALIVAGGGAFAMGLFSGDDTPTKTVERDSEIIAPIATYETAQESIGKPSENPVLLAYQAAIKTGRISDLGQFAQNHPDNSLAKDAQDAAFASLERQGSVLAFNTFTQYFPDADISSYKGPRVNADVVDDLDDVTAPASEPPSLPVSTIRASIDQRAKDLEPFIAQGEIDYALIVIDEMLALTDLNEFEATFLLNLRAITETSGVLITSSDPLPVTPQPNTQSVPADIMLASTPEDASVVPDITTQEAETTETASAQVNDTAPVDMPSYDEPAKPLERFGAITPDDATEPGECDMFFDVLASGAPTNIDASCTNAIFVEPAKDAVSNWVYAPATRGGEPVRQNDVIVKIKFHLE
ncbi:MAG: zinc-ribbon domain-containing protein [Litorimonas sp.]